MRIKPFSIVLTLFFLLGSCEKENAVSVNGLGSAIIGAWSRTDVVPSGVTYTDLRYFDIKTTYTFDSDKAYSYRVDFYGFEDENPEAIIGSSENVGTYEVRGDSLFIKAVAHTSWEKGFKPDPETTRLGGKAYGYKFGIVDDELTLYYISYPADAPVPTQMTFERVVP
ncbi:hypothetical protein HZY62_09290 [Maribacter polysiphoniae]|uniref:Lipocalin-like protein n=1 Tax=Maribacter polysiphoniae TaxID=429344 RepID=A0A316E354_9FLAO|nr:hypothetical protein [Maribacter polysiphoniae]MBD1260778.1 hypothetical protein [Maribacter polysiphoniae]PWK24088.1 hypothetical protein LX92_01674 [Maribacter polysiphoniae]